MKQLMVAEIEDGAVEYQFTLSTTCSTAASSRSARRAGGGSDTRRCLDSAWRGLLLGYLAAAEV